MEVSGVTVSASQQAALTAKATSVAPKSVYECEDCYEPKEPTVVKDPPVTDEPPPARAVEVFRQELNVRFLQTLGVSVNDGETAYDAVTRAVSGGNISEEALAVLNRLAGENPDLAASIVAAAREDVEAAVQATESVVADDADLPAVEASKLSIQDGLDLLDGFAAQNVPSSASVLAIESESRERTAIRIRTQEGDVVTFRLRNIERLQATDAAVSNGNGSATETVVSSSLDSRLRLTVDGDLNEAELEAIRGVFEQADAIATEFFDGDFAAALSAAASLTYDTDQLARVKLRFRSVETTNVTYAAAIAPPVVDEPADVPAAAAEKPALPAAAAAIVARPTVLRPTVVAAPKVEVPAPVAKTPAASPSVEPVATTDAVEETAVEESTAAPDLSATLASFFDRLGEFLRGVADGFPSAKEGGVGLRYHYSESFKLDILKSVVSVSAPEEREDTAVAAGNLIDRLIEVRSADIDPIRPAA